MYFVHLALFACFYVCPFVHQAVFATIQDRAMGKRVKNESIPITVLAFVI